MDEPDASLVSLIPIPSSNPSTSSASNIPTAPAAPEPAPQPPPARIGLLTRAMQSKARAQMVEAPSTSTTVPIAGPSTTPFKLRRKEQANAMLESREDAGDSSSDSTPKKPKKRPAGIDSPPDEEPESPIVTGNVFSYATYERRSLLTLFQGYVWPLHQKHGTTVQGSRWG